MFKNWYLRRQKLSCFHSFPSSRTTAFLRYPARHYNTGREGDLPRAPLLFPAPQLGAVGMELHHCQPQPLSSPAPKGLRKKQVPDSSMRSQPHPATPLSTMQDQTGPAWTSLRLHEYQQRCKGLCKQLPAQDENYNLKSQKL